MTQGCSSKLFLLFVALVYEVVGLLAFRPLNLRRQHMLTGSANTTPEDVVRTQDSKKPFVEESLSIKVDANQFVTP